jgi:hypothetical protein
MLFADGANPPPSSLAIPAVRSVRLTPIPSQFPILAKRMISEFGDTRASAGANSLQFTRIRADALHRRPSSDPESHRLIHAGLDRYGRLLTTFRADATSYDPSKLRAVMDSFRKVLFEHLDQEVADLGQQNMIRYVRPRETMALRRELYPTPFRP